MLTSYTLEYFVLTPGVIKRQAVVGNVVKELTECLDKLLLFHFALKNRSIKSKHFSQFGM